jgi:hypothetical protein
MTCSPHFFPSLHWFFLVTLSTILTLITATPMTEQTSTYSTAAEHVPYNDDWERMSSRRRRRLAELGEKMSDLASNRYGQEFRRISNEFEELLDEGMKDSPWYEGFIRQPLPTPPVRYCYTQLYIKSTNWAMYSLPQPPIHLWIKFKPRK